jgi:hypothetical protein
MKGQILQDKPTEYIDDILLKDGQMQVLKSSELRKIPNIDLRLWCHKNGIYGIPSEELIDTIKAHIVEHKSIEVGAGCGVFGRALDIPSTDSFIQSTPEMAMMYKMMGQPPVTYGDNVEELEASEAIAEYSPDVVFGSWVTQYVSPLAVEPPVGGGSVYGLKESDYIKHIKKYIIYGNENVHGNKEIFADRRLNVERIFDPEHFFSRATVHDLNCLYIVTHVN